ncbi:MAG: hypothetical protein PVF85_08485 [Anaerolineales bacterium]|jgi:hypothetical protein
MDKRDLENGDLRRREREKGMMIGMLMFFPIGIALFLAIGNPGFIGVGVAIGLSIGLAIGDDRYRKLTGEE